MPKIEPAIVELSEKIHNAVSFNAAGEQAVTGNPYLDNAPATIPPEILAEVRVYDKNFTLAGTRGLGLSALKAFKEHPELSEVTGQLPFGGSDESKNIRTLNPTFRRHNGEEGDKEKYMVTDLPVVRDRIVHGNTQLNHIREELNEFGRSALASCNS